MYPTEPPYDPEVYDMSEAEHDRLVRIKRRIFLALVQDLKQRWTEYVEEAEYQDGLEYWGKFDTPSEGVEDFRLYDNAENRIS